MFVLTFWDVTYLVLVGGFGAVILGRSVAVTSVASFIFLCLVAGLLPSSVLAVLLFVILVLADLFWVVACGVWCLVVCQFGLVLGCGFVVWLVVWFCIVMLVTALFVFSASGLVACLLCYLVCCFGFVVNSVVVVIIVWFVLYAGDDLRCCSWGLVVGCFGGLIWCSMITLVGRFRFGVLHFD